MPDDFYVGYLPEAPPAVGKRVRGIVLVLLLALPVVAVVLLASQKPFAASRFEFGTKRNFEGTILERPYPMLLVDRPGHTEGAPGTSLYWLTVFGKHGADAAVRGLDGKPVQLQGELIYRDGRTMIQIVEGTVQPHPTERATTPPPRIPLGTMTLIGEIVDSKCFLGVMKPGNLKPHRACATRCISGGVPPVLLVRDAEGGASYFLLVGPDGRPVNREVLGFVAEPVRVTGEVERWGDLLVLRIEPETISRVEG